MAVSTAAVESVWVWAERTRMVSGQSEPNGSTSDITTPQQQRANTHVTSAAVRVVYSEVITFHREEDKEAREKMKRTGANTRRE